MKNKKTVSKTSRLIAWTVIVSLLAGCSSYRTIPGTSDSPAQRVREGPSTGEQVGIGMGIALVTALAGYLIDKAVSEDGKNPGDPAWDSNGPVVPENFNFSDLKIGAYVQGGWPLALDYQLSRPASATLVVTTAANDKPFVYQLDGSSDLRRIKIIKLPESLGEAPARAILEIHAVENTQGITRLVPIRIFGIACGNKAVGSIGIDQIDFSPANIRTSLGEVARHSFFARKSFSKVQEEFRTIQKLSSGPGEAVLVGRTVFRKILDPFRAIDESTGEMIGKNDPDFTWDGKTAQKQVSKGFHQLQIRAWYKSSKDWLTAFSPGQVMVVE